MTKLEIIRMGHPTLKQVAKPFTKEEILSKETRDLVDSMFATMKEAQGIGLAAPQINISKQLAIIHVPESSPRYKDIEKLSATDKKYIVFNPSITIIDPTPQGMWEGCLSVPGLRGYVERPRKIKVHYLDEQARPSELILEDLLATVFQHELDHLFGIIYLERIKDPKLISFNEEYEKFLIHEKK